MKLKTMLLGGLFAPLALGLLSGRKIPESPDQGLAPGERIPSIVVGGNNLGTALANEPKAILVVWSVDNAKSRVANLWASNSLQTTKIPVYSICIDGDDKEATLYAKIDGAKVTPIALEGKKTSNGHLLTAHRLGKVYYASYGVIEKVISAETLFDELQ